MTLLTLHTGSVLASITSQLTDSVAQHGVYAVFVLALAGSLGYLAGALVGWGIGARGGRALIDRHGRWLHISPQTFRRAEDWFERYAKRAVFLSRVTPVVRSFISIPAGVFASPLAPYTVLTLLGSLLWCFAFAGVGWAGGGRWEHFHHSFRYADYAAVALLLALASAALLHRRRQRAAP